MIRTILVPVAGDGSDDAASWTALAAARLLTAHLEFLLVHVDTANILAAAGSSDFGVDWMSTELLSDLEKEDQERAARAQRFFQNLCEREQIIVEAKPPGPHGISAEWLEEMGDEASQINRRARFNDLSVVSPKRQMQGFSSETIETVVMGSGRPILLAPPQRPSSLTRTVVIAWKETAEAARAVTASMPFLSFADKIIVLSISETGPENIESANKLADQLRWHRLDVEARIVAPEQGDAPQTLVRAAQEAKADLIVMGAYGHNRVREMIFGGFTKHVLNGIDLPVLLCH